MHNESHSSATKGSRDLKFSGFVLGGLTFPAVSNVKRCHIPFKNDQISMDLDDLKTDGQLRKTFMQKYVPEIA